MTVMLELSPEKEEALNAEAKAQGITADQWLQRLVDERLQTGPRPKDTRPIWEVILDEIKDVPPEAFASMPKDGASQIDHYVYGTPKRDM